MARRPIAQEDIHAEGNAFLYIVDCKAFVVCQDTGTDIGLQRLAGQTGAMAVNRLFPFPSSDDFVEHIGHSMDDAGRIHKFAYAQDALVLEDICNISC